MKQATTYLKTVVHKYDTRERERGRGRQRGRGGRRKREERGGGERENTYLTITEAVE